MILLNKNEDEEMDDREMNEAELAELFAGWFGFTSHELISNFYSLND